MEEPVIMLLEDYLEDADTVNGVLSVLEEAKVIATHYQNKNTLDFFSREEVIPAAMFMYMNNPELISVQFAENAYMLLLDRFGLSTLEKHMNCEVMPSGANGPISIIQFLSALCGQKEYILAMSN